LKNLPSCALACRDVIVVASRDNITLINAARAANKHLKEMAWRSVTWQRACAGEKKKQHLGATHSGGAVYGG